jgi:hypothetical protein
MPRNTKVNRGWLEQSPGRVREELRGAATWTRLVLITRATKCLAIFLRHLGSVAPLRRSSSVHPTINTEGWPLYFEPHGASLSCILQLRILRYFAPNDNIHDNLPGSNRIRFAKIHVQLLCEPSGRESREIFASELCIYAK